MTKLRATPHSLDAERAILGAILHGGRAALLEVRDQLGEDDFWLPGHAALYAAACSLDDRHEPIDPLAALDRMAALKTDHLLRMQGGADYVADLSRHILQPAQLRHFAGIVRRTATQRRVIQFLGESLELAYAPCDDIAKVAGVLTTGLATAIGQVGRKEPRKLPPMLREAFDRFDARRVQRTLPGLTTGWDVIDGHLGGGLCDGHLVLVGGRPGMGKSAWVMQMAVAAGAPTLVFSLEMSADDLVDRLLAQTGPLPYAGLRAGLLPSREFIAMQRATGQLMDTPLWIDDEGGVTFTQVSAKARRWRAARSLEAQRSGRPDKALLVIDYLQLIQTAGGSENRAQEMGAIAAGVKALAKELACPIVAIVSLNRDCDKRADKRPMLSDIKESGIESDADAVMFVYRESVYTGENEREAEILVEKSRHGTTGTVKLRFDGPSVRFGGVVG